TPTSKAPVASPTSSTTSSCPSCPELPHSFGLSTPYGQPISLSGSTSLACRHRWSTGQRNGLQPEKCDMKLRYRPLVAALALATSSFAAQAQDRMTDNDYWWPNSLDLRPLRAHATESDPFGGNFDYAEAFSKL